MPSSDPEYDRLRECPECGLFQRMPALPSGGSARCPRCHAVLRHRRAAPAVPTMAFALTGLMLFAVAANLPLLNLRWAGLNSVANLGSGPLQLDLQGMLPLSLVIVATTIVVPLARLMAVLWVLVGLRAARPPRHLYRVFRWVDRLRPWSMIEVFLLGLFVAYTKLADLATVSLGTAAYALGALMLAMAAADAALDEESVWRSLETAGATAAPLDKSVAGSHAPVGQRHGQGHGQAHGHAHGQLIGCDTCGLVSSLVPGRSARRSVCPRCGSVLRERKPNSLGRTAALLLAAAILYIPANLLPVMTVVRLGQGEPNTILSGVRELLASGMWPLAGLVFFASILVPMLKLAGLSLLMLFARHPPGRLSPLRRGTLLYRTIEVVGRWSMIDVFMVSILTALVRWDRFASITPGAGVLAFCAVVILTMLASASFDSRLIWDRFPASGVARPRPGRAAQPA